MSRSRYVDSPDIFIVTDEPGRGLALTSEGRQRGIAVDVACPEGVPTRVLLNEDDVRALRDLLDDWLRIEVIC